MRGVKQKQRKKSVETSQNKLIIETEKRAAEQRTDRYLHITFRAQAQFGFGDRNLSTCREVTKKPKQSTFRNAQIALGALLCAVAGFQKIHQSRNFTGTFWLSFQMSISDFNWKTQRALGKIGISKAPKINQKSGINSTEIFTSEKWKAKTPFDNRGHFSKLLMEKQKQQFIQIVIQNSNKAAAKGPNGNSA